MVGEAGIDIGPVVVKAPPKVLAPAAPIKEPSKVVPVVPKSMEHPTLASVKPTDTMAERVNAGARALKIAGVSPPQSPEAAQPPLDEIKKRELIDQAIDLFSRKEEIRRELAKRKPNAEFVKPAQEGPKTESESIIEQVSSTLTLEEKLQLIKTGRCDAVRQTLSASSSDAVNQGLVEELKLTDTAFNDLLANNPWVYEGMVDHLNEEAGVRQQAREARRLNQLVVDLLRLQREAKTIRAGEVPLAKDIIDKNVAEYKTLIEAARNQANVLLSNTRVFARYEKQSQKKLDETKVMGRETTVAQTETASKPEGVSFEEAKKILGDQYIGIEGVQKLEAAYKANGIPIEFNVDPNTVAQIQFTREELTELTKDKTKKLLYRPAQMIVNSEALTPTDSGALEALLNKSPLHNGAQLMTIYSSVDNIDLNERQIARKGGYEGGVWVIVDVEPHVATYGKTYFEQDQVINRLQQELIQKGAVHHNVRRRTTTEALMDWNIIYAATGKPPLENTSDWTSSVDQFSKGGSAIVVGLSGPAGVPGIDIKSLQQNVSHTGVGVCVQRT